MSTVDSPQAAVPNRFKSSKDHKVQLIPSLKQVTFVSNEGSERGIIIYGKSLGYFYRLQLKCSGCEEIRIIGEKQKWPKD